MIEQTKKGMPVFDEEIFVPVASVIRETAQVLLPKDLSSIRNYLLTGN